MCCVHFSAQSEIEVEKKIKDSKKFCFDNFVFLAVNFAKINKSKLYTFLWSKMFDLIGWLVFVIDFKEYYESKNNYIKWIVWCKKEPINE